MGKYRFRKMYFLCANNVVIDDKYEMVNAFRRKEYADKICAQQNQHTNYYYEQNQEPKPLKKVEGFYLVPEKLFDEVLKQHCKET